MRKFASAVRSAAGRVVVGAGALVAATAARADGVDISAAVTAAKTDIGTAGGLIIGVVVAVAAFAWIRRVIK
jgi:hypothetical protein